VRMSRRVIRWRLSEVRRWEAALEKAGASQARNRLTEPGLLYRGIGL
jgi:hypothetical protein